MQKEKRDREPVPAKMQSDRGVTLEAIAGDYGRMVSALCRRLITNEDTARDAAQQVWVAIIKSFPSFRGESKISTWIYTITRRVALDYARNERLITTRFLQAYSLEDEFDPPGATDLDKTIWIRQMCDKCITGILHCVDNETRLAYMFRHIADLGYGEIAGILEKEEATVRQMVARSRKKLNSFLSDTCTLYRPDGNCRCRMKKWVDEINLADEYQKIGAIVRRVNFYKKSEMVLPRKNYWESFL
jgi:RNA polymerase sigma-70 factor (ECF subfamily)